MKTLFARITAHRPDRRRVGEITFRDGRGEVCTRACRSTAHRDRVTIAAYRARL
ncbi:hypothetical protein AB0L25_35695 [Spirillospora sp. NPDC052242]